MAAPHPQNATWTLSTLPHELLGEIFSHCAKGCPDAPLVLGAVSPLFRHIVNTTPTVWGNLHLALDDDDTKASKGERGRAKAALWVARSKACPIAVKISVSAATGKTDLVPGAEARVPAALKLLRDHIGRISALCLRTDTQTQARAVLAAVYGGAEAVDVDGTGLRSLHICVASEAVASALPLPAIPTITEMETTNVVLGALPTLGLARLQHLHIAQPLISRPVAVADVIGLAHFAPALQSLHVEARISDPDPARLAATEEVEACFLPHLVELSLRTNNVVPLLDQLVVPALRTLHVRDLDGARAGASGEMGAALHRLLVRMELGNGELRSNELRVLELAGVVVEQTEAVWERCMQRMKALEMFSVLSPPQEEIGKAVFSEEVREIKAGFSFGFGSAETKK
ncbi:hypothetical protein B0H11DRAFT_1987791 [Mycena galericulata]|nr:hypothetical protein B0H11DRAFT_1987791 [Mycena galericulata]